MKALLRGPSVAGVPGAGLAIVDEKFLRGAGACKKDATGEMKACKRTDCKLLASISSEVKVKRDFVSIKKLQVWN
jgi:hypothetical protein